MKVLSIFPVILLFILAGCRSGNDKPDAYGNFEANEVIVSSRSQGVILRFAPEEGYSLEENEVVAVIDTTQLHLNLEQLKSGRASLNARLVQIEAQLQAQTVQLKNLKREAARLENLYEGGAATQKQLEDLEGQTELLEAQMEAGSSQKLSVFAEQKSLEVKIRQAKDLIDQCVVRSPVAGVMLAKYREQGELVAPGQSLFKIAPMEIMILRAYISGGQLSQIRPGSSVKVRIDGISGLEELDGRVSWISPRAEFTPKVIQTREERISLVYAIKVLVPNDGRIKIGMPGEVYFQ